MKFLPKQVTLDLEEYNQIQSELKELKRPSEDGSLTATELQEATGILLVRALNNPSLFKGNLTEIDLGKYKAIFAIVTEANMTPRIDVSFVRT